MRAHVTAVADPDSNRAASVAARFGTAQIFPDGETLIAAGAADVVAVLTPPASHRRLAELALDHGLHLLLEKPAGLTIEDADALVAAAQRQERCALMGFHMRWHRLIQRARRQIDERGFGEVEAIRGTWNAPLTADQLPSWKRYRADGGGALFEIAANLFDLWRYLLQDEMEEVLAFTRSGRHDDESAGLIAKFAGGTVATAQVSGNTAHNIELEISGSLGRLCVSGQRFDGYQRFARHETPGMAGPRLRSLRESVQEFPAGLVGMRRNGDYGDSYREMWRHLLHCIQEKKPVACALADGREALRGVLAAVQSAESGRPVPLADKRSEHS